MHVHAWQHLIFTHVHLIVMSNPQGVYIWVAKDAPQALIQKIFGVQHFGAIPEIMVCAHAILFFFFTVSPYEVFVSVTVTYLTVWSLTAFADIFTTRGE